MSARLGAEAAGCRAGVPNNGETVGFPRFSISTIYNAEWRRCAKLRIASRILALLAGSIGSLVLVGGWILDYPSLRNIIPNATSMKVNTAIGLVFTAGAILLGSSSDKAVRRLVSAMAVLLIVLSAATLLEDMTGRNFRIDELFAVDRTPVAVLTAPGRMAVVSAIGFLLLGIVVLRRDRPKGQKATQLLAVIVAALCVANLVGYLYGIANFAGIAFYTTMAVHTSFSLFLLSLSLLFSRPDRGLMVEVCRESLGGVLTRRLLPAAVLVPVALGWLRWQGERQGWYGTPFGLAFFATANVVTFVCLVFTAGRRLNKIEAEKIEAASLLESREELLNIFVKSVPAAVAMLDRNMRYLQVSDRWCSDYGIRSSEILGRSLYEVFPDIPERWKTIHRQCLAGETLRQQEDHWERAGGESTWLHWEIRPWGERNGLQGGILVFTENITDRKKEELELRKFVSLADNSVEFIGMCDMNFMPFYANPAALRLVGLDNLQQVFQTPVPEFFFPEDQPYITEEFFPRVVREGRAEVEIRFRHFKTGEPIWMIYNVFHIRNNSGEPVGFATVSRDITERKKAEEALRESENTIRTLLDTAAQAILAVDAAGSIVLANRMASEMFGYGPEELVGSPLEILLPERLRTQHVAHRTTFVSSPKARPMGTGLELVGMRKDGSEFPIEVSLSSVPTHRGALAVSFVSDITARKRTEIALRDSERQLRALSGILITAQEDERRRLSRELHDDVTQQLAFLAIELGKAAGQKAHSLKEIQGRIRAFQDQVLRISSEVRRLSHGLHPSVIEDFGLSIALEEFCGDFAKAQGIHVRFDGFVDDTRLSRDGATCLYRVVQEGLRNSVTHGHATEVCVDLAVDADSLQLRVCDNGRGFVADGVRANTGLGLVSMRERVRLVGGRLTLSSQPGKGTELTVSVPLGGSDEAGSHLTR